MSAVKQIQAVARDRVGKGAARAVRREGRVPAVIYGAGAAADPSRSTSTRPSS
jgi:large subunit ribosomal protein L25